MLIVKLAGLPYTLRSKGKMVNTEATNPSRGALVVTDFPRASEGGDNTQNDEYITRLEQEIEMLRREVQHVKDITNLAVTTLQNPPRFPSFDAPIFDHIPLFTQPHASTLVTTTSTTPLTAPCIILPVTPANPPHPSITPYIPDYAPTTQIP